MFIYLLAVYVMIINPLLASVMFINSLAALSLIAGQEAKVQLTMAQEFRNIKFRRYKIKWFYFYMCIFYKFKI